jgi:outer membrane immunogenic protein
MNRLLVSGLFLGVSSSVTLAADLIIEEPAMPIVDVAGFDWTGGYVGIHGGYGIGTVDVTDPDGEFFEEDAGASLAVGAPGFLLGLQAGANWQMDSIVFGVEGQIGYLGASGEEFVENTPDNYGIVDFGMYADLTGRIGIAADTTLFYLKGGVAAAELDAEFGDLDGGDPDPDSFGTVSEWVVGWTVGAGVEFAFDDNWSAKAEYQYYDFGDVEFVTADDEVGEGSATAHTFKVGLNYSF